MSPLLKRVTGGALLRAGRGDEDSEMQYVQNGERVRRMSEGGGEVDEMMTTAQMRWKIVIMNFFFF